MNKSEIYSKAESIINKRRTDAINLNQYRIDEINEKLPEIAEINRQLFNTSRDIFKVIAGKKNAEQKIEELKKSNLEAQLLIKMLLKNSGYPEDYLDIQYHCPDCNDTGYCNKGYSNGEFCHCFREVFAKISSDEMNRNSQIKLSSFDTFSLDYYSGEDLAIMKRIFDMSKSYADKFGENSGNILMLGNTGLGKTHLSLSIANEVLSKGYSVIYDSIINILHKIENEHFGRDKTNDTLSLINETELLILDDLGTEYSSSFYVSTIYNIINTRLNASKSTIISTNLSLAEIGDRYDERIVSRITTMYNCMTFAGNDVRYQKKQREMQKNDI